MLPSEYLLIWYPPRLSKMIVYTCSKGNNSNSACEFTVIYLNKYDTKISILIFMKKLLLFHLLRGGWDFSPYVFLCKLIFRQIHADRLTVIILINVKHGPFNSNKTWYHFHHHFSFWLSNLTHMTWLIDGTWSYGSQLLTGT